MQVNPSLSYKLNDQVSVGAGVQFSWAAFQAAVDLWGCWIYSKQDTDWAYGYNFGVMYNTDG